jgi:dTDP-4-dehydrorhamnose reductase
MRVVLTGASGQLGAYLVERLRVEGLDVAAWSGSERGRRGDVELGPVDLTDGAATIHALEQADPEVVLHAAAVSSAEAVRRDPARARAVNVTATATLADWCRRHDRRLVYTSTDLVFDGSRPWNREDDPAEPILEYGRTKRAAERFVREVPRGLVARVSLLYGASRSGREAFFDATIAALRRGEPRTLFEDEFRTPLDLASAAAILVWLARSEVSGTLHVAGRERVSRFELIRRTAAALGLDPSLVRSNRRSDAPQSEPRPADVSLDTTHLAMTFPDLKRPAIEEVLQTLAHD